MPRPRRSGSEFVFSGDSRLSTHCDTGRVRDLSASCHTHTFSRADTASTGHANRDGTTKPYEAAEFPERGVRQSALSSCCAHQ